MAKPFNHSNYFRHSNPNKSKAVDSINKKLKKSDETKVNKIDLTNYGPGVLFKMEDGQNGENTIKINRGHRAYNFGVKQSQERSTSP